MKKTDDKRNEKTLSSIIPNADKKRKYEFKKV